MNSLANTSRSTLSSAFASTPRRENHFSTPRAWISGAGLPPDVVLGTSNSDDRVTLFISSLRVAFPLGIEGRDRLLPIGRRHILAGILALSKSSVQAAAQVHDT